MHPSKGRIKAFMQGCISTAPGLVYKRLRGKPNGQKYIKFPRKVQQEQSNLQRYPAQRRYSKDSGGRVSCCFVLAVWLLLVSLFSALLSSQILVDSK